MEVRVKDQGASQVLKSYQKSMSGFGKAVALATTALTAFAGAKFFSNAFKEARQLEEQMKVIQGLAGKSTEEFRAFEAETRRVARGIGSLTAGNFAAIEKTAVSMGVEFGKSGEKIIEFSKSVGYGSIALSSFNRDTTMLSQHLAKQMVIFELGTDKVNNMMSAMFHLETTTAASALEISDFNKQLGASAKQIGLSQSEASAWGATLIAAGMDASNAATRVASAQRIFIQHLSSNKHNSLAAAVTAIKSAADGGASAIEALAKIVGKPKEEIVDLEKTINQSLRINVGNTFLAVNKALGQIEDGVLSNTLAFDLYGAVGSKSMLTLAGNSELLEERIKESNEAFEKGERIGEAYQTIAESNSEILKVFGSVLNDISLQVGEPLLKSIANFTKTGLIPLATEFSDWLQQSQYIQSFFQDMIAFSERIAESFKKTTQNIATFVTIFSEIIYTTHTFEKILTKIRQQGITELIPFGDTLWKTAEILAVITGHFSDFYVTLGFFSPSVKSLRESFVSLYESIYDGFDSVRSLQDSFNLIYEMFSTILSPYLKTFFSDIKTFFIDIIINSLQILANGIKATTQAFDQLAKYIGYSGLLSTDWIKAFDVFDVLKRPLIDLKTWILQIHSDLQSIFGTFYTDLTTTISQIVQDVQESFSILYRIFSGFTPSFSVPTSYIIIFVQSILENVTFLAKGLRILSSQIVQSLRFLEQQEYQQAFLQPFIAIEMLIKAYVDSIITRTALLFPNLAIILQSGANTVGSFFNSFFEQIDISRFERILKNLIETIQNLLQLFGVVVQRAQVLRFSFETLGKVLGTIADTIFAIVEGFTWMLKTISGSNTLLVTVIAIADTFASLYTTIEQTTLLTVRLISIFSKMAAEFLSQLHPIESSINLITSAFYRVIDAMNMIAYVGWEHSVFPEMVHQIDITVRHVAWFDRNLKHAVGTIGAIGRMLLEWAKATVIVIGLRDAAKGFSNAILEITGVDLTKYFSQYGNIFSGFSTEALVKMIDYAANSIIQFMNNIVNNMEDGPLKILATILQDYLQFTVETYQIALTGLIETIGRLFSGDLVGAVQTALQTIGTLLQFYVQRYTVPLQSIIPNIASSVNTIANNLRKIIEQLGIEFFEFVEQTQPTFDQIVGNTFSFVAKVVEGLQVIVTHASEIFQYATQFWTDLFGADLEGALINASLLITEVFDTLVESIAAMISGILPNVSAGLLNLGPQISAAVNQSISGLASTIDWSQIDSIFGRLLNIVGNVTSLFTYEWVKGISVLDALTWAVGHLVDKLLWLADVSLMGLENISTFFSAAGISGAIQEIKDLLDDVTESFMTAVDQGATLSGAFMASIKPIGRLAWFLYSNVVDPIMTIIALITGAGGILKAVQRLGAVFDNSGMTKALKGFFGFFMKESDSMTKTYRNMGDQTIETTTRIQRGVKTVSETIHNNLGTGFDKLRINIKGTKDEVITNLSKLDDGVSEFIERMTNATDANMYGAKIDQVFKDTGEKIYDLTEFIASFDENLKEFSGNFIQYIQRSFDKKDAKKIVGQFYKNIEDVGKSLGGKIGFDDFLKKLDTDLASWATLGSPVKNIVKERAEKIWQETFNSIKISGAITKRIKSGFDEATTYVTQNNFARRLLEPFDDGIVKNIKDIGKATIPLLKGLRDEFSIIFSDLMNKLFSPVEHRWKRLLETIQRYTIGSVIAKSFISGITAIMDKLYELWDMAVGHSVFPDIYDWVNKVKDSFSPLTNAIEKTKGFLDTLYSIGKGETIKVPIVIDEQQIAKQKLFDKIENAIIPFIRVFGQRIGFLMSKFITFNPNIDMNEIFEKFLKGNIKAYSDSIKYMNYYGTTAQKLFRTIAQNFNKIIGITSILLPAITELHSESGDFLRGLAKGLSRSILWVTVFIKPTGILFNLAQKILPQFTAQLTKSFLFLEVLSPQILLFETIIRLAEIGFKAFGKFFSQFENNSFLQSIGEIFYSIGDALEFVVQQIDWVYEQIEKGFYTIFQFVQTYSKKIALAYVDTLGWGQEDINEFSQKAKQAINFILTPLQLVSDGIHWLIEQIIELGDVAYGHSVFPSMVAWIERTAQSFKPLQAAIQKVQQFISQLSFEDIGINIQSGIQSAKQTLQDMFAGMSGMQLQPAFAIAGDTISPLYDQGTDLMGSMMSSMQESMPQMASVLQSAWGSITDSIFRKKTIAESMIEQFKSGDFVAGLQSAVTLIIDFLTGKIQMIAGVLDQIFPGIAENIQRIREIFSVAFGDIIQNIADVIVMIEWKPIFDAATNALQGVITAVVNLSSNIVPLAQYISNIFVSISKGDITGIFDSIGNVYQEAYSVLGKFFGELLNQFIPNTASSVQRLFDGIGRIAKHAVNLIGSLVTTIATHIEPFIQHVSDFIYYLGEGDWIAAIESAFLALREAGMATIKALATGLKDLAPDLSLKLSIAVEAYETQGFFSQLKELLHEVWYNTEDVKFAFADLINSWNQLRHDSPIFDALAFIIDLCWDLIKIVGMIFYGWYKLYELFVEIVNIWRQFKEAHPILATILEIIVKLKLAFLLLSNPIGWVITAVYTLVKAIQFLGDVAFGHSVLPEIIGWLEKMIKPLQWLEEKFGSLTGAVEWLGEVAFGQSVFPDMVGWIEDTGKSVKILGGGITTHLTNGLEKAGQAFMNLPTTYTGSFSEEDTYKQKYTGAAQQEYEQQMKLLGELQQFRAANSELFNQSQKLRDMYAEVYTVTRQLSEGTKVDVEQQLQQAEGLTRTLFEEAAKAQDASWVINAKISTEDVQTGFQVLREQTSQMQQELEQDPLAIHFQDNIYEIQKNAENMTITYLGLRQQLNKIKGDNTELFESSKRLELAYKKIDNAMWVASKRERGWFGTEANTLVTENDIKQKVLMLEFYIQTLDKTIAQEQIAQQRSLEIARQYAGGDEILEDQQARHNAYIKQSEAIAQQFQKESDKVNAAKEHEVSAIKRSQELALQYTQQADGSYRKANQLNQLIVGEWNLSVEEMTNSLDHWQKENKNLIARTPQLRKEVQALNQELYAATQENTGLDQTQATEALKTAYHEVMNYTRQMTSSSNEAQLQAIRLNLNQIREETERAKTGMWAVTKDWWRSLGPEETLGEEIQYVIGKIIDQPLDIPATVTVDGRHTLQGILEEMQPLRAEMSEAFNISIDTEYAKKSILNLKQELVPLIFTNDDIKQSFENLQQQIEISTQTGQALSADFVKQYELLQQQVGRNNVKLGEETQQYVNSIFDTFTEQNQTQIEAMKLQEQYKTLWKDIAGEQDKNVMATEAQEVALQQLVTSAKTLQRAEVARELEQQRILTLQQRMAQEQEKYYSRGQNLIEANLEQIKSEIEYKRRAIWRVHVGLDAQSAGTALNELQRTLNPLIQTNDDVAQSFKALEEQIHVAKVARKTMSHEFVQQYENMRDKIAAYNLKLGQDLADSPLTVSSQQTTQAFNKFLAENKTVIFSMKTGAMEAYTLLTELKEATEQNLTPTQELQNKLTAFVTSVQQSGGTVNQFYKDVQVSVNNLSLETLRQELDETQDTIKLTRFETLGIETLEPEKQKMLQMVDTLSKEFKRNIKDGMTSPTDEAAYKIFLLRGEVSNLIEESKKPIEVRIQAKIEGLKGPGADQVSIQTYMNEAFAGRIEYGYDLFNPEQSLDAVKAITTAINEMDLSQGSEVARQYVTQVDEYLAQLQDTTNKTTQQQRDDIGRAFTLSNEIQAARQKILESEQQKFAALDENTLRWIASQENQKEILNQLGFEYNDYTAQVLQFTLQQLQAKDALEAKQAALTALAPQLSIASQAISGLSQAEQVWLAEQSNNETLLNKLGITLDESSQKTLNLAIAKQEQEQATQQLTAAIQLEYQQLHQEELMLQGLDDSTKAWLVSTKEGGEALKTMGITLDETTQLQFEGVAATQQLQEATQKQADTLKKAHEAANAYKTEFSSMLSGIEENTKKWLFSQTNIEGALKQAGFTVDEYTLSLFKEAKAEYMSNDALQKKIDALNQLAPSLEDATKATQDTVADTMRQTDDLTKSMTDFSDSAQQVTGDAQDAANTVTTTTLLNLNDTRQFITEAQKEIDAMKGKEQELVDSAQGSIEASTSNFSRLNKELDTSAKTMQDTQRGIIDAAKQTQLPDEQVRQQIEAPITDKLTNSLTTLNSSVRDLINSLSQKKIVSSGGMTSFHAGGILPRFHTGGKLEKDEVPAILQTGEYVLSRAHIQRIKQDEQLMSLLQGYGIKLHHGGRVDTPYYRTYNEGTYVKELNVPQTVIPILHIDDKAGKTADKTLKQLREIKKETDDIKPLPLITIDERHGKTAADAVKMATEVGKQGERWQEGSQQAIEDQTRLLLQYERANSRVYETQEAANAYLRQQGDATQRSFDENMIMIDKNHTAADTIAKAKGIGGGKAEFATATPSYGTKVAMADLGPVNDTTKAYNTMAQTVQNQNNVGREYVQQTQQVTQATQDATEQTNSITIGMRLLGDVTRTMTQDMKGYNESLVKGLGLAGAAQVLTGRQDSDPVQKITLELAKLKNTISQSGRLPAQQLNEMLKMRDTLQSQLKETRQIEAEQREIVQTTSSFTKRPSQHDMSKGFTSAEADIPSREQIEIASPKISNTSSFNMPVNITISGRDKNDKELAKTIQKGVREELKNVVETVEFGTIL